MAKQPVRSPRVASRVALLHGARRRPRAMLLLARTAGIEIHEFSVAKGDRGVLSGPNSFDALLVDRPEDGPGYRSLMRRWRRRFPHVPVVALGASRATPIAPWFALRAPRPKTAADLRETLALARRYRHTGKRARRASRRARDTARRLSILTHIVGTANSILEPKRVIALIMSQIQVLIPSEAWSILLVDEEKRELSFEMALGEKGDSLADIRLKLGEGIAGWVAQTGKPVIVNDARRDPRFQSRFDAQTQFTTRSILCAPLVSRGHTLGVVEILNRASGTRFTKRDLDLLLTLVEPAAIALENALLFEKTERLAITDDLTKLYNSRYLSMYLDREIRRAKRQNSPLALIFLDIDGFKSVNDRHGHLCGSRALFELGAILQASVRETDIVSRYGGDEFVVVLPETDAEQAAGIAQRIRSAFNAHPFLTEFNLKVHLSASFGISAFPRHGLTPSDLIQKADQAMYRVKEAGKDGVKEAC